MDGAYPLARHSCTGQQNTQNANTHSHTHYILPRAGVRPAVTCVRAVLDYIHTGQQGHCLLFVMGI